MARHDYKFRPDPKWEDELFVPPAPIPVAKHPDEWDFRDNLESVLALSRNPVEATTEISMTELDVQVEAMGQTMMIASSSEVIRYIFVDNASNYRLHPVRQALLKPMLKDGLLTAEGDLWKFARKALSPVFVPRHIKRFAASMVRVTDRLCDDLFPVNTELDISEAYLKLTYAVLSETLFSGEIDGETDEVLRDIAKFLSTLGKPNPLDLLMAPNWIPRLSKLRGLGAMKRLRKQVIALAQDRRTRLNAGHDVPEDLLTRILQSKTDTGESLSDAQIEDQIITFVGAGHETTSRALTWMTYLLSQDVKNRERFEAELDNLDLSSPSEDWIDHLPFTMACFKESMRLYPPAPFISRQAIEADQIDNKHIPKDCGILINLWALHRHRKHWTTPDAFVPDRFLPSNPTPIERFAYLPFGLGHRVCIGQQFAMQEAAIMIAVIFKRLRLNWIDGTPHPWPVMRITTRPAKPLMMRVKKRQ